DHRLVVGVEPLDSVLLAQLGQLVRLHPGQCDQVGGLGTVVGVHVLLAGPTEADHTGAQLALAGHASPFRFRPVKTGGGWFTTDGVTISARSGAAHFTPLANTRLMSGWW